MPQCIFCDKSVPHRIAPKPSERSLCLDCLVELKRFELQSHKELVERTLPPHVREALVRLRNSDPADRNDPTKQEQLGEDLQTIRDLLPYS